MVILQHEIVTAELSSESQQQFHWNQLRSFDSFLDLEEDFGLSQLPVVVSAQHHLGDPLTRSFKVSLTEE